MTLDVSVRFIPVEYCEYQGRRIASRTRPALCIRGETKAFGIFNDDLTIEAVELPPEEVDISLPVKYDKEEYPIPRYLQHLANNPKPHTPRTDWLLGLLNNLPEDFPDEEFNRKPDKPFKPKTTSLSPPKSNLIASLAEEYKLAGSKIRKFLRKKGFSKPYDDEEAIRTAMKDYK